MSNPAGFQLAVKHDDQHSLIHDAPLGKTYRVRMDVWGADHRERSEAIVAAVNAATYPAPYSHVRVIPLDWVEHGDRDFVWYRAISPAGYRYNIEDDGFSEKKHHLTVGQLVLGNFETLKDAQDAAQADYERRILSAIVIGATR